MLVTADQSLSLTPQISSGHRNSEHHSKIFHPKFVKCCPRPKI